LNSTNNNPNWIYKYSENLSQNIAFNKSSGWVYCEDGTKYSPEEYAILKSTGKTIPLQVHLIKKILEGILISAEPKQETKALTKLSI